MLWEGLSPQPASLISNVTNVVFHADKAELTAQAMADLSALADGTLDPVAP